MELSIRKSSIIAVYKACAIKIRITRKVKCGSAECSVHTQSQFGSFFHIDLSHKSTGVRRPFVTKAQRPQAKCNTTFELTLHSGIIFRTTSNGVIRFDVAFGSAKNHFLIFLNCSVITCVIILQLLKPQSSKRSKFASH